MASQSLHHIIAEARTVPGDCFEAFIAPARQAALTNPDLAGQIKRIERLRQRDSTGNRENC